ncbi:MAG TPA: potassium transporter [Gammaproteobacteria bacterium]|nr:potassium transporter [Gammaproteobacteria bacterium]
MHITAIVRIWGFFSIGFSLAMLPPIAISIGYNDGEAKHFIAAMALILVPGIIFWAISRRHSGELATRDGFIVVALFWAGISMLAAWPFMLGAHLNFVDAMFEAVSAVTTTGATVITGLDNLPPSLLFYRQELQWLGGMGMIVLAVAILPMLGVGGMQLYRAEAPGPFKEEKMTPRLAHTARLVWMIYLAMTVANALAYWLAGMSPFDAISHSLSTVSTGGFSTHDESLGYFHSSTIEAIAIVFMLLGAINFSVHYLAWHNRRLSEYLRNTEVRTFLLFVLAMIIFVGLILRTSGQYETLPPSIRNATFEVVSVVTSTGFGTVDFSHWPVFLPTLLIIISFVGGCGGSTAGGMKVMRVHLLVRQVMSEVTLLIHPQAVVPVRIGKRIMDTRTTEAVRGFLSVYVATFVVLMLLMMLAGLDQVSAFSAIATCMNNLGPGLGQVASTFSDVSDMGKIVSMVAMLLGRLEIFTILVLLAPEFWRG